MAKRSYITVEITEDNLAEVFRQIEVEMDRRLNSVADRAVELAKKLAPVDTGALRDSIQKVNTEINNFRIIATVPYAQFVELGTRKMRARPFLAPAMFFARKALEQEFS